MDTIGILKGCSTFSATPSFGAFETISPPPYKSPLDDALISTILPQFPVALQLDYDEKKNWFKVCV